MNEVGELRMVFDTAQTGGDPFSVWQAATTRLPAGGETLVQTNWRVDLPANPRQAQKALTRNQARIESTLQALPQAKARLVNFGNRMQQIGLEFAMPAVDEASAEIELQRFLVRTQRAAQQSYGLDNLLPQIRELMDSVNILAQNICLSLANYALVESSQAGRLVGRTRVSWLGDFTTEWGAGLGLGQVRLHRQAVVQALATRQSWVRIGLFITAGGASLTSVLAGNPLALLGVFQFVRQVITEFQALQPQLRGMPE